MKKITIYTYHELQSSYSCLIYLKDSLRKQLGEDYLVRLYSKTEKQYIYDENHFGYEEFWYGRIRGVRYFLVPIVIFLKMLFSVNTVYIINDLEFFLPAYFAKKLRKKLKIIHYNTEIHGADVVYPKVFTNFYEKHANFPDVVIDCLKERAEYRKKRFNIDKKVYVIDNTLPKKVVDDYLNDNDIYKEYIDFDNDNPILAYAGGCNLSRDLDKIIETMPKYKDKLNYIFFCHGTDEDFDKVKELIAKYNQGNGRLYKAIPKDKLFNVLNHCHIGINYYDPKVSKNHLYASPSKFFEYIALGLNVISSDNEGINHMINNDNLGVCIKEGESIDSAIQKLLDKGLNSRENIIKVFDEKYAYEIDSKETIDYLVKFYMK